MKGLPTHFARACLKGAVRCGIEPQRLLDYAEIEPNLLNDEHATVSHQQLATLFKTIWKWSEDEFMGLGKQVCQLGYFRLLTTNQVRNRRLLGAINYAEEHYRVTRDDAVFELLYEGDNIRLIHDLQCHEGDTDHLLKEYYLLAWERYLSWLIGAHIDILETTFSYAPPEHHSVYPLIFRGQLKFNQRHCSLVFHSSYLRQPIKRSLEDTQRYVSRLPLPVFYPPDVDQHFSAKVKTLLAESSPSALPDLKYTAQALRMNPRTLHRKLQDEGTRFQRIKDRYRYQLAIDCLTEKSMNVTAVSNHLGFSESAAFCHFFKKVGGIAPSKYVQLH